MPERGRSYLTHHYHMDNDIFFPHNFFMALLGLGSAIVILPFALNLLLFKTIANTQSTPFSNYSYTYIGLASGKGLDAGPAGLSNHSRVGGHVLALQKIRSAPALFMRGILGSYQIILHRWVGLSRFYFIPYIPSEQRETLSYGDWF